MKRTVHSITLAVAVCAFATFECFAQTPEEMTTAQTAEHAARKAFAEKAYPEFLTQMIAANAARPNHSRLIYNLATAYVLNAENDKALSLIERLAKMGLAFAVERDPSFKPIADSERFKAAQALFAKNREPIGRSQRAFTADDKTLIAESIAYNPKTQTYYMGSVHQRKIIAIDKNGVATDFSKPAEGLWSVLGMRVDAARGSLWVCTSAFPQMRGFSAEDKGRAGIFKYELATGKLVKKYILPPSEAHALGDLIIDRDGSVFATDSIAPAIYKISAKGDTIEEFLRSNMFSSLQGLAFDNAGANLLVADYSKGIFRVDLSSKEIVQQKPAENITLLGIDGIYQHNGSLIAIQNGVSPNRVMRLSIVRDQIVSQEILEANHPDFDEPTLGVLVNDDLYFIANSQWNNVNEKAELAVDKLRQPVVLRLKLKK